MIRRIQLALGILAGCLGYVLAQTDLSLHEYWVDDNYEHRTIVSSSNSTQQYEVDLSALSLGIHYFNHRTQDADGEWGAMTRSVFYLRQSNEDLVEPVSPIAGYEYWVDDDYEHKVFVASTNESNGIEISLDGFKEGTHFFNYRAINRDGRWGAITRNAFFMRPSDEDLQETISPLAGYEYWLDDDYDHKVFVASTNESNGIEISLDGLKEGTHFFNYRAINKDGLWGAITRNAFFMRPSDEDLQETIYPLAGYEYWIDDDYENRVYKKTSSGNIVASVPIDELKSGVHYLNFRSHNEAGIWGALTRNIFYLHGSDMMSDEGGKIIGYRYKFNEKTTYVSIEPCNEYSLNNKIITMPAYEEFASLDEGCKYEFMPSNIRLTRENNSVFSLQFENENHKWSVPAALELCIKDTLDRATVELKPQNSVKLNKVPSGDFNALRLDIIDTNNYYFKATQPCRIDLYTDDGKLYQTIESNQIVKLCEAGFIEGTYYGIVRDHVTNSDYADETVTIRMLLTEGLTPDPVISFADSTLTITAMDGARIYYTLDGSTPNTNSTVYTSPFKVLQNCTVKAIAHHPDLAVSDVTTYKIDTYKVAMPEVIFTNLKIYMSCSTPKAKIYYTVNGSDPRSNGTLYTEPVTINYNCTVKAVAKLDGYNDSEVLEYVLDVDNVRCMPPTFTRNGNTLTLSSLTDDVTFYYTLDGNSANPTYEIYNGVITLSHNGVVSAYCSRNGYLNSETATYTVDWFKAATPEFDIIENKIAMLCTTDGAKIYYTTDGSTPNENSAEYKQPIPMTPGMVVKAVAYAPNFNPSEVVTFDAENLRCIMPTFSVENNRLTISTTTVDAHIYYTMDGAEPTTASHRYESPITLTENCEIKAFAVREGRADSYVASYTVDWFKAESPKFTLDGHILTITSATPNADIYYTIGGKTPDKSSTKYVAPIELTDNKIIKAIVYAANFNDSEVAIYTPDVFVCDAVLISYDGRYVGLESTTSDASIYYTTNGTTPTSKSNAYTGKFDAYGLATIKATAIKPNFKDAEVSNYKVEYYFDGKNASLSKPGLLDDAFEWCATENISSLCVTGSVNGDDIALMASLPTLKHLDIEEVDVEDNTISANAFAGSPIVSICLPKTIENVGNGIFAGCQNLASIQWNASRSLPSAALSGFSNPNLLLYVKINSHAPSNVTNVVASNYATSITLVDGEGNTNFYCPKAFTAKHIKYNHNYAQETVKNACAGWETLSLPFDVQAITHSTRGALAPFAAKNPVTKPFWLCKLANNGFIDAAEIVANTPYIISMPNNLEYADDYILAGDVTFSADNVVVPVTTANISSKNEFLFSPTTVNVAKSHNVYALNVGERYEGFLPGSTFVDDYRDVRPFEACLMAATHSAPRMMSVARLGFEDDSALDGLATMKRVFEVRGENGRIFINTDSQLHVDVYSSLGALVRSEDIPVGISYIGALPAGIYLVNGQKVVVR